MEPLRKALTEAREAASQARASVRHLDAECTRVWNTTYSETLKQETEYNAD